MEDSNDKHLITIDISEDFLVNFEDEYNKEGYWFEEAVQNGCINYLPLDEFIEQEGYFEIGGFSQVSKYFWSNGGITVALKHLNRNSGKNDEKRRHPNLSTVCRADLICNTSTY
ncbi:7712_t:CDS:2, partial [Gigaspora rosea]